MVSMQRRFGLLINNGEVSGWTLQEMQKQTVGPAGFPFLLSPLFFAAKRFIAVSVPDNNQGLLTHRNEAFKLVAEVRFAGHDWFPYPSILSQPNLSPNQQSP